MTVQAIVREVRKLSAAEQSEVLDTLAELVHPGPPVDPLTPAQREDLDKRVDEYRSGRATLIPGDEAFARLRGRH
jgi:putative addiction module component (TIGR02574 family)